MSVAVGDRLGMRSVSVGLPMDGNGLRCVFGSLKAVVGHWRVCVAVGGRLGTRSVFVGSVNGDVPSSFFRWSESGR